MRHIRDLSALLQRKISVILAGVDDFSVEFALDQLA